MQTDSREWWFDGLFLPGRADRLHRLGGNQSLDGSSPG